MPHDPLAGFLPDQNPLAPFEASPAKGDSASAGAAPAAGQTAAVGPSAAAPVAREPTTDDELEILPHDAAISPVPTFPQDRLGGRGRSRGRDPRYSSPRRRSRNAPLILGMGVLVCVAIGVCAYLLTSGYGISQNGELLARAELEQDEARERAEAEPARAAADQANRVEPTEPRRRDPVMGGLTPEPRATPGGDGLEPVVPRPAAEAEQPQVSQPRPAPPQPPGATSPPAATSPRAEPPMEDVPKEAAPPEAAPMADAPPEAVATNPAGDAPASDWSSPLEPAMTTLRSGEFSEMMAAAAQAQQVATTPEERELAAGMALLAELADYYVEGIRRGAAGLGAAETFEIVPDMPVIVVESSREHLVLKVNGRVKRYPFETMPLVLAHRLTKFSLPADDPVAIAAAGAYQALWPQATDAHRRQAFEWWKNLEGDAGEAEFSQLEPTIREIFQMPNP